MIWRGADSQRNGITGQKLPILEELVQQRERVQQEQRAERLVQKLRDLDINPEEIYKIERSLSSRSIVSHRSLNNISRLSS